MAAVLVLVNVENSTISGNSASGDGGGIFNAVLQTVAGAGRDVTNSTFSGNSATGNGGGIYNYACTRRLRGGSELGSTILNAGSLGENIFNAGGTVTSHGYNLSSDNGGGYLTGPGDQIDTDPMLGPLQDNGGPPSRMRCCPAARRLMQATRASLRRLSTTSAAPALIA